tara:strand:- start:332 stop:796 length:465 start_codon:yes stop_codon:yes gene_type:complete
MATFTNYHPTIYDDCITPVKVWKDIQEYIPKDKDIWCPFYFKGIHTLRDLGYEIIHNNEDFFETDRGEVIIDNPPFSLKKRIVERLIEMEKPFILLMPVSTLCYNYMRNYRDKIQIIIPPKRINFAPELKSSASFDCLYYCYKMNLPQDIIWLD